MLTLNSAQLRGKLPDWLRARMAVLLVGPPGTGKTWTSRRTAIETFGESVVEVIDGGQENAWKGLFPYKTPSGQIELGAALRASGYVLSEDGTPEKCRQGGCLILDEVNRVPPELKTQFQLLASERIVPWPEGGSLPLELAIVATANDSDLGVEEAGRAELDRYDLIVRLLPTAEEMRDIVSSQSGVTAEAAEAIRASVVELSEALDPKKAHQPEGLRLMISVAKIVKSRSLSSVDAFTGAAERCWPLGRRGAEKYRGEFDATVATAASKLAGRLANLGSSVAAQAVIPQLTDAAASATTLYALAQALPDVAGKVSTGWLPLPLRAEQMVFAVIQAFGLGVAKHLLSKETLTRSRAGVSVRSEEVDKIKFESVDRVRVEKFIRALVNRGLLQVG